MQRYTVRIHDSEGMLRQWDTNDANDAIMSAYWDIRANMATSADILDQHNGLELRITEAHAEEDAMTALPRLRQWIVDGGGEVIHCEPFSPLPRVTRR